MKQATINIDWWNSWHIHGKPNESAGRQVFQIHELNLATRITGLWKISGPGYWCESSVQGRCAGYRTVIEAAVCLHPGLPPSSKFTSHRIRTCTWWCWASISGKHFMLQIHISLNTTRYIKIRNIDIWGALHVATWQFNEHITVHRDVMRFLTHVLFRTINGSLHEGDSAHQSTLRSPLGSTLCWRS